MDNLGLGRAPAAATAGQGPAQQAAGSPEISEQDRLATLSELLPPLVSALAEALEVAAAAPPPPAAAFGLPLPSPLDPGAGDAAGWYDTADPCLQAYADATEYIPLSGLDERTAVVRAGRPALVGLLLRVTLGAPAKVAAGLATCRLLPELPELREAVELQQRLRAQVSLPDLLSHLAAVVRRGEGGLGPGARARLVAALRADVESRWSELIAAADEDAVQATAGGELLPSAAASAWELAAAAAEYDDPMLSDLAAKLLAAAGLHDPRAPPPPRGLMAEGSELPGSKGRFPSSVPVTQLVTPSAGGGTAATGTAAAGGRTSRRTATAAAAAPAVTPTAAAAGTAANGRRSSRRNGMAPGADGGSGGGGAAAAAASSGASGGGACGGAPEHWLVTVLRLMAEQYLVSDDARLIVECQSTAIKLLMLPAGRAALEGLGTDCHTHRHLRIYLPSPQALAQQQQQQQQKERPKDASAPNAAKEVVSGGSSSGGGDQSYGSDDVAISERLWQVPLAAAGGADAWLRRLTPALLSRTTDEALRLMTRLAGLQAAVCEALFPALLQDLATEGAARDPSLPLWLARRIQRHVLEPHTTTAAPSGPPALAAAAVSTSTLALTSAAASAPLMLQQQKRQQGQAASVLGLQPVEDPWIGGDLRAVQIVLGALEHLRRLHRRVVSERKPPGHHGSRGAAAAAAARPGWEVTVDGWETVYGLQIDYLAVARAAARCRQPATALIYTSHWAEQAMAAVRLAHRLHADQQQQQQQGAGGGKGGGGSGGKGGGGSGGKQRDGGQKASPPPAVRQPQPVPFVNAFVQGGVHSALQVLPLCRPEPPGGTQDALSVVLDVYGAIDDPDALYALPETYMLIGNIGSAGGDGGGGAAAGSAGSGGGSNTAGAAAVGGGGHPQGPLLAMRLFERERQWPEALAGHDLAMRPTACTANGAVQQQYGASAGGSCTAAAAGIVTALRHLGGDVTAQYFLNGLALSAAGGSGGVWGASGFGALLGSGGGGSGGSPDGGSLSDLQYELSWRLSDWGRRCEQHQRRDQSCGQEPPAANVGMSGDMSAMAGAAAGLRPSGGGGGDAAAAMASPFGIGTITGNGGGGGSGGGGGGFHEAVHASLAALAASDLSRVESLLGAASHAAIRRFATKMGPSSSAVATLAISGGHEGASASGGGSSGSDILDCLVEFRMLGALHEACQLLGSRSAVALSPPASPGGSGDGNGRGLTLLMRGGRGQWVGCTTVGGTAAAAAANSGGGPSLEPLRALRGAALAAVGRPREQAAALAAVVAAARKGGATAAGLAAVRELRGLLIRHAPADWVTDMRSGAAASWRLEEARLVRRRGDAGMAAHMALALVSELEVAPRTAPGAGGAGGAVRGALPLATALSLAGAWCAEAQVECGAYGGVMGLMGRAADIAVQALEERQAGPTTAMAWEGQATCKVLHRLASYADQRYREFVAVLQSPEHVKRMSVVAAKRREAAGIGAKRDAASGQMRAYLEAQLRRVLSPVLADEEADAALRAAQTALRSTALANYGRCLCAGDRHDLSTVYRLCQMWLQPADGEDISAEFATATAVVPSYKWLPLVYQMASRLSAAAPQPATGGGTAFQKVLQTLLLRLASDHPFHVVYQIIALRNGNLDKAGKPQPAADSAGFVQMVDVNKIKAADSLLQQLVAKGGRLATIVKQAEKLVRMYIDLAAMHPPQEDSPPPQPFPANLKRQVDGGALDELPVVSAPVPVDPSATYDSIPYLVGFDATVSYAGGINKPKIIVANDSDGAKHRQLVKSGNDDLRQDAVMQQTFALINGLLARDSAAARRGLKVATYRVVPFSPTAGLLQWVEDTQPLNQYLLGKNYTGGAHARYMPPGEWNWIQCYNHIKTATDAIRKGTGDAGDLLRAFEEACRRFSPCLHHFLLEAFPAPSAWLAGQAAYTRSTAAASMAGYLLGLGDRHSGNILLHGATGEVVHIDLGIAFEQGRFLVTPELVPFRLTRDVVDGMGINGVEGPFRRSCEETLRVLRNHAESLLTVLEVVLHDPLHKWSLTLAKARQKQPRDRGSRGEAQEQQQQQDEEDNAALLGNADAARAVLRVKQKLEGRMDAGGLGRAAAGGGAAGPTAGAAAATTGAAALAAAAAAAAADAGGAPLNVEGQVRALLAEAQDPNRLSRMYVGWSPWL